MMIPSDVVWLTYYIITTRFTWLAPWQTRLLLTSRISYLTRCTMPYCTKGSPFAPLVMRLINTQAHGSPLAFPPNFTEHTLVSLQQKGYMGSPPRRSYANAEEEITKTERPPSP